VTPYARTTTTTTTTGYSRSLRADRRGIFHPIGGASARMPAAAADVERTIGIDHVDHDGALARLSAELTSHPECRGLTELAITPSRTRRQPSSPHPHHPPADRPSNPPAVPRPPLPPRSALRPPLPSSLSLARPVKRNGAPFTPLRPYSPSAPSAPSARTPRAVSRPSRATTAPRASPLRESPRRR